MERLEHFEMLPVNYDFFAQIPHVIVEYLDRVKCFVNGNQIEIKSKNSFLCYCRHQLESQLKSSENNNNQLVTTNGNINEDKSIHIESKDIQVN